MHASRCLSTTTIADNRIAASDAPPSAKRNSKGGKQKPLPPPRTQGKPYSYTYVLQCPSPRYRSIPRAELTPTRPSHSVFPFGVNDPSVGNLSTVHAPWDPIASPAGWHAVPDTSNPYSRQSIPGQKTGLKGPWVQGYKPSEHEMQGAYRNGTWTSFATTMGNNVFAQESVKVPAFCARLATKKPRTDLPIHARAQRLGRREQLVAQRSTGQFVLHL